MKSKKVQVLFSRTVTDVVEYYATLVLEVPLNSTEEQIREYAESITDDKGWKQVEEEAKDHQQEEWVAFVEDAEEEETPDLILGLGAEGKLTEVQEGE